MGRSPAVSGTGTLMLKSPLWWSKPSAITRYAVAVLSIALAVAVSRLLFDFLHTEPFVSLFLCAILFVAWFGGSGPGFFAVALAVLAFNYYLVAPINSFGVAISELPRFVLFVITALFVNFLSASQRNAAESLRRSRDDLLTAIEDQRRIESALRRSEMHLAEAQRLSHTGSIGLNISAGEIFWSDETFRIFEYDRTIKPTVERSLQRVHPEDVALVQRTLERAAADVKDFDVEHRLLMPGGSVKHVHAVAHPVKDASGSTEFVGAVMDITAAKRAETLLAGEKHLLEMVARGDSRALILDALCRHVEEQASGCLSSILLLDSNTNCLRHGAAPNLPIKYTNAVDGLAIGPSTGSCGTAAYRAEQVIVSDIAADPLWADYRDLALEYGLRSCWSTPILSSAGRVLGTFAIYYREPRSPTPEEREVLEQITHFASIAIERKQAEEVLREQASLLDLTHDTVFVRDMSNVITYWNRGAEELYGWTAEEAVGKMTTHQMLRTVFPAPIDEILGELLRTGRWEGDLLHTKRDGAPVVVASRWSLQRDEHGLPVAILETNNDITKRKQSEEALRQAQSELAHAARVTTLGELTASVAHEVNQPLAGVVSSGNACLRWLANQPPNIENAKQSVERIIRDANRASEVVARVRALATKAPVQKGWFNINEMVLDTLALTRMEVAQHRASLKTQLSEDVPLAWADRIQLQQVILNLVINAIEAVSAAGDGPRDLFIGTATYESDGVLLTVRDSGSGLDPEKLERIFDAFYSTKREGMGLGLAVSRSIIEAHGGRLWAMPNEPRGAVFQFTLPTSREEAP
jgi:two-component system sensor kinase FixL